VRKAQLGIAGVVLLAVGVAIGLFVGTRAGGAGRPGARSEQAGAPGRAGEGAPRITPDATRFRAGHPELLAPAPLWEEWKYPDSRVHTSANAGKSGIPGSRPAA
jgi:hypothetical protein